MALREDGRSATNGFIGEHDFDHQTALVSGLNQNQQLTWYALGMEKHCRSIIIAAGVPYQAGMVHDTQPIALIARVRSDAIHYPF